jgi:hypothetical protein
MPLTNNTITTIDIDIGSSSKLIEALASETIYPGMIVTFTTATDLTVAKAFVGSDGERKYLMVAIEDTEGGKTVSDAYLTDETVKLIHLRPGDLFYVQYQPTAGANAGQPLGQKSGIPTTSGQVEPAAGNTGAICYTAIGDAGGASGRLVAVFAK